MVMVMMMMMMMVMTVMMMMMMMTEVVHLGPDLFHDFATTSVTVPLAT